MGINKGIRKRKGGREGGKEAGRKKWKRVRRKEKGKYWEESENITTGSTRI